MANRIYEFDPVTHITTGALGAPGQRVFYLQAERGLERIDLLCEKQQVQALADAIDELVGNLADEFGLARSTDVQVDEIEMTLKEPLEPLFRVGAMGLGYDANRDRVLLVAQEIIEEGEQRDPLEVRFFATRSQMEVLSARARDIVSRGRPPEIVALQAEARARRNGHGE